MKHFKLLGLATAASFIATMGGKMASAPRALTVFFGGATTILAVAVLIDMGAMPGQVPRDSDRLHKAAVILLLCETVGLFATGVAFLAVSKPFGFLICTFASVAVGGALCVVLLHRRRYVRSGLQAAEEYVREHE